jgi:hypothetical protein
VSPRHQREAGQAGDRHIAVIGCGSERAIALLVLGEIAQTLIDGELSGWSDHPFGRAAIG